MALIVPPASTNTVAVDWINRKPTETRLDWLLRLAVAALVFLFPAACLIVDRSDSAIILLLGAVGLYVWITNDFGSELSGSDWTLIAVFFGFFLVGVLTFVAGLETNEGFRLLGRYLRFLFVLPVLMALRRYRPPALVLWCGLGTACLVLGVDAIWERVVGSPLSRPQGVAGVAIVFGDLAGITTMMFVAGWPYLAARWPRAWPLILLCVLSGLLATLLSGTRGIWIALPLMLLPLWRRISWRWLLAVVAAAAGVAVLAVVLPGTQLVQRARNIATEYRSYRLLTAVGAKDFRPPECLNMPSALGAWADVSYSPYPIGVTVTIVGLEPADQAALTAYHCVGGAAVRLSNHGVVTTFVELLRHQNLAARDARTQLLVTGQGAVAFAGQPTTIPADPGAFRPLQLTGPATAGTGVTFTLPPGTTLSVVPLETYYGEYRYPMLDTPIGLRLQMWAGAWTMFTQAPLLGVGLGAYQNAAYGLVAAGTAGPNIANYDHPHSDYLDALSSRGLLGLAALLLLLGLPGLGFARRMSGSLQVKAAAIAGLVATAGFAICSLTETMFLHSIVIGWYVVMNAILLVSLDTSGTFARNSNQTN